jgi:hypothetical protein
MTPEALAILRRIDLRQERLITVLFGDLDNENPRARFPALESTAQITETRVERLEHDRIRIVTFASFGAFIIGLLSKLFVWHK